MYSCAATVHSKRFEGRLVGPRRVGVRQPCVGVDESRQLRIPLIDQHVSSTSGTSHPKSAMYLSTRLLTSEFSCPRCASILSSSICTTQRYLFGVRRFASCLSINDLASLTLKGRAACGDQLRTLSQCPCRVCALTNHDVTASAGEAGTRRSPFSQSFPRWLKHDPDAPFHASQQKS